MQCFSGQAYRVDECMKWLQRAEHAIRVFLCEVEPRSFFQRIMPPLMPQNGDANELVAYKQSLSKASV